MTVCIVLIIAVAKVLRERYRTMGRQIAPAESVDTLRLRDEVRQMKDRIQVLERVITDNHKSVDLDREIEQLRDR
ncbi:hypothetical protein U1701_14185 [Sphingomonas sp. PB2P19]|uniref:hypothetical protein n=1 Tax=Sphingomonas rhamnosi TaxID=3096156 RepID=UPI002FC62B31